MNINKSILERLDKLKSFFADDVEAVADAVATDEATEEVVVEFAEVTLVDGETVLSYEGDLTPGTAIFVVTEGEQIPAREGTHVLGGDFEGVSIVVDAEGIISEVIDEREAAEEAEEVVEEEAMSSEDVEGIVDGKLSAYDKTLNAFAETIEALTEKIKGLSTEFSEYKDKPSTEQKETKKFARVDEKPRTAAEQRLLNNRKKQ